jgi:peptide chain release factor subunit 1
VQPQGTVVPRSLSELVDRLARQAPSEMPVLSLYLDTRPDQHGRDHFQPFARKELGARAETFPPRSPEREAFEEDRRRIESWLRDELEPSANGAALFASSAAGLFEAIPLAAPFPESRLHVAPHPHLYPLLRLVDQYPRYAALIADTRLSRLFVFGLATRLEAREVRSLNKVSRTQVGGWSQLRYQRRVDDQHRQHVKETVDTLARIVREEELERIILAGDEVVLPLLRAELTPELAARVVDELSLDVRAPEHEVLAETLAALREHEAATDAERAQRLLDEYRAGGLAAAGLRETEAALARGQVHELILGADPQSLRLADSAGPSDPAAKQDAADRLVRQARQTDAAVVFIEDPALLAPAGGVGATLRYRLNVNEGAGTEADR